uniref:Uncharacterized protein n=1 Tax=Physcomitrium patens TaxID=3218 RepID=A0A2K1JHR2_PHYPA|nr:hypothetical protein PHYPA_018239 [Physcomitrium patens]
MSSVIRSTDHANLFLDFSGIASKCVKLSKITGRPRSGQPFHRRCDQHNQRPAMPLRMVTWDLVKIRRRLPGTELWLQLVLVRCKVCTIAQRSRYYYALLGVKSAVTLQNYQYCRWLLLLRIKIVGVWSCEYVDKQGTFITPASCAGDLFRSTCQCSMRHVQILDVVVMLSLLA